MTNNPQTPDLTITRLQALNLPRQGLNLTFGTLCQPLIDIGIPEGFLGPLIIIYLGLRARFFGPGLVCPDLLSELGQLFALCLDLEGQVDVQLVHGPVHQLVRGHAGLGTGPAGPSPLQIWHERPELLVEGCLELSEHPTAHPGGEGLSGDVIAAQAEVRVPGGLIEMEHKTGHRGPQVGGYLYADRPTIAWQASTYSQQSSSIGTQSTSGRLSHGANTPD